MFHCRGRSKQKPLCPDKVDSDKRTRAEAVTPLFEAGKVLLPESAPWLNEYLDELASFPAAVHDDAVDSTTLALNYLRGARKPSIVQFWENMGIKDNCKAGKHEREGWDSTVCKHCGTALTLKAQRR